LKAVSLPTIAAVLLGLFTFAVFLPALHNGFVNWDDYKNLIDNPNYRGFGWEQLQWMWTNRWMSHYVPLTWMSFGLDYVIWKEAPLGYHLTNVLLHAANAAVFFLLALELFKVGFSRMERQPEWPLLGGAAFASLFFSLHPLRVESVAWVTERRDVLSGLFYLLALLVYIRAFQPAPRRSMPAKPYFICLGFFMMSLLSKEIAITLPAILLLLDVYPLRRLGGGPGRWIGRAVWGVWLEKIPFLLLGIADGAMVLYFAVQNHLVEGVGALGWATRIKITVYGMAFYLRKTVAPTDLSPLYPLTRYKTLLWAAPFQMSAAIVLPVTLLCLLLRRRFPGLLAVWTACAITLLPVSGLIQNGFQIAADRYSYLACLGYAILAGAAVSLSLRVGNPSRLRTAAIASAALLVLSSLSLVTRKQMAIWRDSDTLWSRAIAVEPSFVAHLNLGSSFSSEGDSLGAAQQFRQAIALWPENGAAHNNLGKALLQLRQWAEAAQEFRMAVQLDPTPGAFNSLAHALTREGKIDEAVAALREALRIDPGDVSARTNLQTLLAKKELQEQGGKSLETR